MPFRPPFHLDPDLARFLMGGVSINAGSGDADGRPSQCRGLGCRVEGDRLTIFFAGPPSIDLFRDVARSGALAVVFSDPPTHRTIQLKGRDARVVPLSGDDPARVAAYRSAFIARLLPLGFRDQELRALLGCADADLAALAFTPEAAFNQTPGALAGTPLVPEAG